MTDQPIRVAQSPHHLLTKILAEPELVASIQALSARTLGKLINHIGLEDAGELVSLATTEQLKKIFDDDLWRSHKPGQDETFDVDRFALWLEVMLEAGEDFTVEKLTELPEDLVTLAVYQHIFVINVDQLAVQMAPQDEDYDLIEKALDSCLYHEFEEYQVISKNDQVWDAILSILVALDKNHHDFLQRMLDRCCYLSTNYIEENGGLYQVLTSEEMLESDVASQREDERAREGFIAPSQAASFLALARVTNLHEIRDAKTADPITKTYFRTYKSQVDSPMEMNELFSITNGETSAKFVKILREAGVIENAQPFAQLTGKETAQSFAANELLKRGMAGLRKQDSNRYAERLKELYYLTNVMIAGCSFHRRRFRAIEATEAVMAVCNLGLEKLLQGNLEYISKSISTKTIVDTVMEESADKLFRLGWHLLHHHVSLPAGQALERMLTHWIQVVDSAAALQLLEIAKAARVATLEGKPWTILGRLGRLDTMLDPTPFDTSTLAILKKLLDECPSLPKSVGQDHAQQEISAEDSGADFFGTHQQIQQAQAFLEKIY